MAKRRDKRAEQARQLIFSLVDEHPHDLIRLVSQALGVTKQNASYHVQKLIAEKQLTQSGKTRRARFFLAPTLIWQKHYSRQQSESDVWDADVLPQISDLPANALDIWRYCFTEMFNNAVDHSSGTRITIQLKRTPVNAEITIIDNGVGIAAENLAVPEQNDSAALAGAPIQQGDVDRIQPVLHDIPQPAAAATETGKSLMPKWNPQRQRGR